MFSYRKNWTIKGLTWVNIVAWLWVSHGSWTSWSIMGSWGPLDELTSHCRTFTFLFNSYHREKSLLPWFHPRDSEFKRLLVILFIFMSLLTKNTVILDKIYSTDFPQSKFREFYYTGCCRALLSFLFYIYCNFRLY